MPLPGRRIVRHLLERSMLDSQRREREIRKQRERAPSHAGMT